MSRYRIHNPIVHCIESFPKLGVNATQLREIERADIFFRFYTALGFATTKHYYSKQKGNIQTSLFSAPIAKHPSKPHYGFPFRRK